MTKLVNCTATLMSAACGLPWNDHGIVALRGAVKAVKVVALHLRVSPPSVC